MARWRLTLSTVSTTVPTSTQEVGQWLLQLIQQYDPLVTREKLVWLEIDVGGERDEAVTWVIGHTLVYV